MEQFRPSWEWLADPRVRLHRAMILIGGLDEELARQILDQEGV